MNYLSTGAGFLPSTVFLRNRGFLFLRWWGCEDSKATQNNFSVSWPRGPSMTACIFRICFCEGDRCWSCSFRVNNLPTWMVFIISMMDSMYSTSWWIQCYFVLIHNFMNTLMFFSMRKLVSKIGASVLERVLPLGNKPWRILVVVMPP